jgi:23S rRNA (adenine2503-C2)-methyltransferase
MGCKFCDVPKVGVGRNATYNDLFNQIVSCLLLHTEIAATKRLNIHFARMGEPTWNISVVDAAAYLTGIFHNQNFHIHPVVSTMMPKNNNSLSYFINSWIYIKNDLLNGEAGLQISINSTNENERNNMFSGNSLSLENISKIMKEHTKIIGRKITLNFAVADYEINPEILLKYFDPDIYLCKLTPMHKTFTALSNGIRTSGDYTRYYPYEEIEKNLKEYGYDVLVFIASKEEDLGRITCGNAILSGTLPECEYTEE